jgi:hypothetical protein
MVDTYLGTNIPGHFCPNYAYHLTVSNGWPTDSTGQIFLSECQHIHFIALRAQQYDPVELDLHQPPTPLDPLKMKEEQ